MSQISFATGWIPLFQGNILQPCSLIVDLVKLDVHPNTHDEKEKLWTLAVLGEEIEKVPTASGALMESVVAIWRLRELGEQEKNDTSWKNHLEA